MAKIRVYELARELNMPNKVLLDKIEDLEISIKSHMSSLGDDDVVKIKADLFGKKEETIVETRVKPTVIRRRKKQVRTETVAKTEKISDEETPQETPVPEPPASKKTAEDKEQEKETDIAVEPDKKPEPAAKAPVEDTPPEKEAAQKDSVSKKKTKKAKKKKEFAAKIIKLPIAPKEKTPAKEPEEKKQPAKRKTESKKPVKEVREKISRPKKEIPPDKISAKQAKKGKKKKLPEPADPDRRFFKKKIAFRKKAVVEGADLYTRGRRGRKGKKGARNRSSGPALKTQITTAKAIKRRIKIDDTIVLSDLAKRMGIKAGEMIASLMSLDVMATVIQTIDFDTAVLVAAEFDYEIERATFEEETILKVKTDEPGKLIERPPVVTIMGHVDHGKTSLLDVIRKTRVTDAEAGGITQHIGAYNVTTEKGQIAFLDTPGHEAFTAMRARGAKVTDIVVLVVAADDGVKPQTIEAINHSKAAEVPIIVAVNKIDKDNADTDRVYRELSEIGLSPEDWGGDTIFVNVSAKKDTGINDLLEMILLQAEVLELKANPDKLARGHVVESKLDSGRGAVATVLVQEGTLKVGEPVVCGIHYGKVRAMLNDMGFQVESAGPAVPVEVIGLSGVPEAGDEFITVSDEKDAKQISLHRVRKQRSKELAKSSRLSLEKLYEKMQQGEIKDLNLIIKADVHGSIEALSDSLSKLSNEEVNINIIHSATGTVTESDISLATVSNAIIVGFNVRPTPKVQALASEESVDMRFYNIIYDIIKDVKGAITGMMDSTYEERLLGRAEVREVFQIPKLGAIAGSYVTDGRIERGKSMRLIRDGVVMYEGKNSSLRRFKDDAKEVQTGYECGIGIENYNDIKVKDVIECFYLEEIKPEIE